jgi:hypothetical protein
VLGVGEALTAVNMIIVAGMVAYAHAIGMSRRQFAAAAVNFCTRLPSPISPT